MLARWIAGYVSKQSTISLAAGVASAGVFYWLESSFAADAKAGNAAAAFRDSVSLVGEPSERAAARTDVCLFPACDRFCLLR